MKALLEFLLGDRIFKAIMDEWHDGDKATAGFVMFCVTATPIMGLLRFLAKVMYG